MSCTERQVALANKTLSIACIVPVHNEGQLITKFIQELALVIQTISNNSEIIIIDDGSTDDTLSHVLACQNYPSQLKVLSLSRNFGKEAALTAGIDHADADVNIIIDADFQHPIQMIHEFLSSWAQGYDIVYGIRTCRKEETMIKRMSAKIFYYIMSKIGNLNMPPHAGDFRLLDRKVIHSLRQLRERSRFMKGLYAWVGYASTGIAFSAQERIAGSTNFNIIKLLDLALIGLTSFSNIPLRIWSLVGLITSCCALLYGIYVVIITMLYGTDFPGFPTIVAAIVFLGGIQLLSIGVLGEYIARIFTETKNRPIYLIAQKHGFNTNAAHNTKFTEPETIT